MAGPPHRPTPPDVTISVSPVGSRADRRAFVDLVWRLYADDPAWVPPLRSEVHALIGGAKTNPWFRHGRATFFLARRQGRVVGRISAQVCDLVQAREPGLGQWGFFECEEDPQVAAALIDAAESWLRQQGMTQAEGPISLSIWDEPGLLVSGFETPPTVMMGHHRPWYGALIEGAGYTGVKDLHAWDVPVAHGFPEIVNRIVAAGERNPRIRVRPVDLARFDREAALILEILNEAWASNWGFVPLTDAEVAHVGRKLKPIVIANQVRIAEYDGVPQAFMISLPDVNQLIRDLDGRLFPFGWARLLWRLRNPQVDWFRVPLMGVRPALHGSRTASLLAFMMIEHIRRDAVSNHGARMAEIGWILEDNLPMVSIAQAIGATIRKTYRIYRRALG